MLDEASNPTHLVARRDEFPRPEETAMSRSSESKKRPEATPRTTAEVAGEQAREAAEAAKARDAEASNRDRMVDIGRAHRNAGRQK
jgi:hypothetical protein